MKWEYKILTTPITDKGEDIALKLNLLGQDGWQAYAVVATQVNWLIYLKRVISKFGVLK